MKARALCGVVLVLGLVLVPSIVTAQAPSPAPAAGQLPQNLSVKIEGVGSMSAPLQVVVLMTLLTFGTMQIENFQNAWLQLTYALVFFVVLACRSWNLISLDGWLRRRN